MMAKANATKSTAFVDRRTAGAAGASALGDGRRGPPLGRAAKILTRFAPCPLPAGGSAEVSGSGRAAPWGERARPGSLTPRPGRAGPAGAGGRKARKASADPSAPESPVGHYSLGVAQLPRRTSSPTGPASSPWRPPPSRCAAAPRKGSGGILTTYRRSRTHPGTGADQTSRRSGQEPTRIRSPAAPCPATCGIRSPSACGRARGVAPQRIRPRSCCLGVRWRTGQAVRQGLIGSLQSGEDWLWRARRISIMSGVPGSLVGAGPRKSGTRRGAGP